MIIIIMTTRILNTLLTTSMFFTGVSFTCAAGDLVSVGYLSSSRVYKNYVIGTIGAAIGSACMIEAIRRAME